MALDSSIPLQGRIYKPESDTNRLAKMLALQNAAQQGQAQQIAMRDAEEARERQNELRRILGTGGGEQELLRGGFVTESTALGKQRRENTKLETETTVKQLEAAGKRFELIGQVSGSMRDQPTYERGLALLQQQGIDVSGFPPQFDPAIAQQGLTAAMKGAEQVKAERDRLTYEETVRRNQSTEGLTRRGQDIQVRGQNMVDARSREANAQTGGAGKPPPGYRWKPDGSQEAIPGGPADVKAVDKEELKRASAGARIIDALDNVGTDAAGNVLKAEDLVKIATGSWGGAGVDQVYRLFGASTKGSQAISQLKVLEGNLMLAQPRMEGPQSDRDVQLYRQMSASVGDSTTPPADKIAALRAIRQLQAKYAAKPQAQQQAASTLSTEEQSELAALRAQFGRK